MFATHLLLTYSEELVGQKVNNGGTQGLRKEILGQGNRPEFKYHLEVVVKNCLHDSTSGSNV